MTYKWIPLTEEELWRNAGLGDLLDKAAAGDRMAQLLLDRMRAAAKAMEPEIQRMKAEFETEIFTHGNATGLKGLIGD